MTKNVVAKQWDWDNDDQGTGGTFNSWQLDGLPPSSNIWSYIGIPYIAEGNLITTGFTYDPTDDTTLSHPALPSPWTSEVSGFYYIDNNTGTSNPTWGDPTAPLDQIPRNIAAGSVVVMAPGSYDVAHESPDSITFAGTASDPCWFIAENPASPPIFRRKCEILGTHTIIEDIDAASTAPATDTASMGISIQNANHITVRRCDWAGNISDGSWSISGSDHIYIYDNDIHDLGDLDPPSDIDEHGINIITSDDIWIINNRIHHVGGDSVQIGGQDSAGPTDTNRVYLAGNTCYDNRQTAIWIKEATDVIVSTNLAYNMNNGVFAEALCFGCQYDHSNVWFINNTCRDSKGGIKFQSGSGTQYVIGNLIYDLAGPDTFSVSNPHHAHAITSRGGDTYVINNTIQNCHAGISCIDTKVMTTENNLIGTPTTANASQIFFEDTTNKSSDNNYYRGTANIRFDSTTPDTLANFQIAGFDGNAQNNSDPLFTNEASDDFTLASGSVCVDAGKVADVYATFLSRYGDSIAEDIAGTSRPVSSWDIGTYERVA